MLYISEKKLFILKTAVFRNSSEIYATNVGLYCPIVRRCSRRWCSDRVVRTATTTTTTATTTTATTTTTTATTTANCLLKSGCKQRLSSALTDAKLSSVKKRGRLHCREDDHPEIHRALLNF